MREEVLPLGRDRAEVDVLEALGSLVVKELTELAERAVVEPIPHREQEVFLVGEVLVDGAAREAGRFGDLLQRGPVEAPPREDHSGGVEQGVAGELPPSLGSQLLDRHRDQSAT